MFSGYGGEQQLEALPAAPGTYHGRRSAIVSICQQLHHAELHAAVDAFLAFSQRTAWHTTPGSVSPTAYLMVVDSQLLQLTSDALCFLRASRLQQACEVSPLEAALLAACAVMVSAVHSQAAPLDTWRPLMEQLLAPQTCGFLLLLADVLAVLAPLDPAQGPLVAAEGAAPQRQPAAPTGHAEAASSPPGRQAPTAPCTREASLRWAGRPQGGRGRSAGLPDLTHLLAVLTALLRELDLLQHLVDLHRAAEEAGAAPAALEPLLETVVAAAACFSRPGQPPTLPAA
ncbi:hypothetical protein HaLaN_11226, partial [Haematococcus lacustris]